MERYKMGDLTVLVDNDALLIESEGNIEGLIKSGTDLLYRAFPKASVFGEFIEKDGKEYFRIIEICVNGKTYANPKTILSILDFILKEGKV